MHHFQGPFFEVEMVVETRYVVLSASSNRNCDDKRVSFTNKVYHNVFLVCFIAAYLIAAILKNDPALDWLALSENEQ